MVSNVEKGGDEAGNIEVALPACLILAVRPFVFWEQWMTVPDQRSIGWVTPVLAFKAEKRVDEISALWLST